MKVPSIQQTYYRQYYQGANKTSSPRGLDCPNLELPHTFYYPAGISFGLEGSAAMKKLFAYGLPCIYTGKELIDSKVILNLIKKDCIHKLPAIDACQHLEKFTNSLMDTEKEVFLKIKEQAEIEPHKNFKEIMQSLQVQYEYELVKKQIPIFRTLVAYSYSLPEDLKARFDLLIKETEDKINRTPVYTRFSVTEFKYKLQRIKDDIGKLHDKKALGIINHFIKMCDDFAPKTNEKNIYKQKKIVSDMETILKRSILSGHEALEQLFETSKSKLNAEKVLIPFGRKAFIYDLSQIIKDCDDSNLKETFMKIAEKLPTSRDSIAAYITKYAKEPSEKTIFCLIWPSIASIEHIQPKSCGGKNELANYAAACASENSDRSNAPFAEWIKKYPNINKNCQKFIDRLIKYARMGIFEKEGIDINYIEKVKETLATQSEGKIIVDTSKLYKGGRFKKPEPAQNESIS